MQTTIPTVAVIVRFNDQAGLPVAFAPITASLTATVLYHGFLVPETIETETDEWGFAVIRLWPNALSSTPSQYRFVLTNPDTGQSTVIYVTIPDHDVFLDDLTAGDGSGTFPGPGTGTTGGTTGGATGRAATVAIGTVTTGAVPSVTNVGTATDALFNIVLPEGAKGDKGDPGVSTTTIISGTGTADTLVGLYAWEGTIVTPPLSATTLDATTLAAYQAAIAGATLTSKRTAGANSIIASMGTAQKLTVKRNGATIFIADYSGAMTLTNDGTNIGVMLTTLGAVSPIIVADVSTGTWTTEITGGTSYLRKITLQVSTDVSTAAGQGYNAFPNLIIPRSVDGL